MNCSKLRRLLADGGPAALAGNREAEDHLVDCGGCFAVLEAMTEIDALLPELERHDVADEVVERLLARSELRERSESADAVAVGRGEKLRERLAALVAAWGRWAPAERLGSALDRARRSRLRWGIVAVPAVLLVGVVSIHTMYSLRRSGAAPLASAKPYLVKQVKFKERPGETKEPRTVDATEDGDREVGSAAGFGGDAGAGEASRQSMVRELEDGKEPRPAPIRVPIPDPVVNRPEPGFAPDDALVLGVPEAPPPPAPPVLAMMVGSEDRDRDRGNEEVTDEELERAMARSFEGEVTVTGSLIPRADPTQLSPVVVGTETDGRAALVESPKDAGGKQSYLDPGGDKAKRQGDNELDARIPPAKAQNHEHRKNLDDFRRKLIALENQSAEFRGLGDHESAEQIDDQLEVLKKRYEEVAGKKFEGEAAGDTENQVSRFRSLSLEAPEIDEGSLAVAHRFLAARERVDDLTFREARGYWANTYVPGDRTLRRLKARLDRAAGAVGSLHEGSRQITQPFDAPEAAALAVYLHADRPGVETRERMLVQVGLKGTGRRSGVRPAMNVGLVLDLRGEMTTEVQTSVRALLGAFAAATELGDRFSLTVAGRPGGTVIAPGDLRHGTLTVALAELFGDDASGEVMSLDRAAAAALDTVRAGDDPDAPLGSSELIVITARRLGAVTDRLAAMAHASAVEGVPWSAIGVGAGVDLAELDAVVLAGQGNRRLLTAPADAEALVGRELAAVSRVVARAVRLRIRLAPGVQLVDVIGSVRLDENRAQQVRDAEQSIDRRLSRTLGIQSDRGLDEEGVQIVIPSFYADDAHVVLLDVVVPGPGPVADVSVRYKDLVHMKNGVARAHLDVPRAGGAAAGPLEVNVLANLLAVEVASRLDRAADAVAAGHLETARSILGEALDLVRGVAAMVDGLAQNPDLAADKEMLTGYIGVLEDPATGDPAERATIADSLRYAGRLKILPPPVNDDETE